METCPDLHWAQGPLNATLIENYSQTYIETCLAGDSSACTKRKVAAYEIWDLSGGYTRFANATLRLGINIANRDPPVSNQT